MSSLNPSIDFEGLRSTENLDNDYFGGVYPNFMKDLFTVDISPQTLGRRQYQFSNPIRLYQYHVTHPDLHPDAPSDPYSHQ